MKIAAFILPLVFSASSFAIVFQSQDRARSCTLFRAASEAAPQAATNETQYNDREVRGFILRNMEVDFVRQVVTVEVVQSVVMGLNRPLVSGRSTISSKNPEFKKLINQLNRSVLSLDAICINSKNEIVYAVEPSL